MDRNYRKSLLAGGLMLVCVYAKGQEVNTAAKDSSKKLKEVVIHQRGSTTQMSMLDPLKRELISSRELLKAACCNLSESFETTPSVDVAYTDAVSGYKQIQMLGLASPYTLITRENIPDTRGLAAITGLSFTPGTFIESMQLSKGTGSVVNGYESLAGQINVEWKKPFKETDEKALINMYQNSQGRTEGNLVLRHQFNQNLSSNLLVNARSQWLKLDGNSDGFLDQPLDKQLVVANRWFWFAPKKWEVQGGIKGSYLHNTGGQWDYKEGTEQLPGKPWGYNLNLQRAEGWAKIGKVFNKPATSMGLQLSGVYHDQDAVLGATTYSAIQKTFYANFIYQTIIGNTNHVIKGGISNMVEQYDETYNGTRYLRNELVPGVFAEYTHNFSDKLNVVAGLRGDYHNIYGGFLTPRLHIRYAPLKKTVFRASFGRAQRTANIFAENMGFMASNRTFLIQQSNPGNPYGLAPEVAWNMGLNFTQKFTIDYRDGAFSLDYYYTSFQNHIVMDVGSPYTVKFYNLNGIAYAHSLQAQIDYELIHNLNVRLSYRWYDTRTTFNGVLKERILVPAHRAFANIGYETRNSWKFDYTVQLIGAKRVPTLFDNVTNQIVAEHYSPWYWQMNAQVTKKISEAFDVYVGGENLTNYKMAQPIIGAANPYAPGFDASMVWGPIMGRSFYGGFRYKIR